METKDLKAGQEVYVSRMSRGMGGTHYVKATVTKVTPSGLVDVRMNGSQADMRFRADCREQGGDTYYVYRLELDIAAVERRIAAVTARREEQQALNRVKTFADGMRATEEEVAKLEVLVELLKVKMAAASSNN